jgi:hypothetical protein
MSRFGVHITDTSGVYRGNFGPLLEGLRFSTVQPGGCGSASFRVPATNSGTLAPLPWLGKFFDVSITEAGRYLWRGRIEDIELSGGRGGRWWTIGAVGYGAALDDLDAAPEDVSGVTTSTLVSDLATAAGIFDTVSITASGFTLSGAAAIDLPAMSAMARIAWAAQFGDSSFRPQVWHVYPGDLGDLTFTFGPRPTTPAYEGYLTDFEAYTFGLQGHQLYNRVTVGYNNGASSATVNDTALQGPGPDGWDITRALVRVMPHITQSADATQAANVLLSAYKAQRMAATALVVPAGRRLPVFRDANDQAVAAWWLRAGYLFRFRDVDPGEAAGATLGFLNSFLIDETEYDEDTATLTLRPESFDNLVESSIAAVRGVLGGRLTP